MYYFSRGLLLAVLLVLAACKQETPPPLPPEKMQVILQEMLIVQQGYELSGLDNAAKEQKISAAFKTILKNAQITQSQFNTALTYYYAHPEQLEQIYTKIIESLQVAKEQE